jgi:predicted transcriptional regulator
MHRSKLESYEAILGALAKKPLSIDRLAYRTSMDCNIMSEYLTFLMANGVVEERNFGDKTLFAITERGATVFRTLDFQKYLKKLSMTFMTMDQIVQDMPVVLKRRQKPPE